MKETPIIIEVSKRAISADKSALPSSQFQPSRSVPSSPNPRGQDRPHPATAVQPDKTKRVSKGKRYGHRLRGTKRTRARPPQSNDLRDRRLKCPICLKHDVNCVPPCGPAYCRGCWDSWARLSDECGHCRQTVDLIGPLYL